MGLRVALVGTAQSWKSCPFDDPGLRIHSLNDAYVLNLPRVDAWWEMHPLDHMHFRTMDQRVIHEQDVPAGYYVRPQGHLDQLKAMAKTIPVYLQAEPPEGWPVNARRFDIERAVAEFGDYFASGPAYMVAQAIWDGAEEIQVWGIHLETDAEYREQRPNFEFMLGIAKGRGIRVVMAPQSPVLKHGFRYAYQPRPAKHPAKLTLIETRQQKQALTMRLAALPRWANRAALTDQLRRASAVEWDCLRAMSQRQPVTLTPPVYEVAHG
ncbi:MAG: hypothetical protein AB7P99_10155 [Vicinamibacterales bacterium]